MRKIISYSLAFPNALITGKLLHPLQPSTSNIIINNTKFIYIYFPILPQFFQTVVSRGRAEGIC